MEGEETRRIAIIGLGLIGGSLGLAIKAAGQEGMEVVGHDRDRGVEGRARSLGAVDRTERDLPRAVGDAQLVVIATPILAIREVMEQIAPHLPEGCAVSDTASTKAQVLGWAEETLPAGVSFVGGHPLAGKESQGIDNAEATLFAGKTYAVVPAVGASEAAVDSLLGVIRLVGARPTFLDATEHDQYVAAVSHLPLLVSAALFSLVRASPGWPDLASLAASAFRDLTRLASGDPEMSQGICLTNRDALLHWLDRMVGELQHYRGLIQDGGEELFEAFAQAQAERDRFLAQGPPPASGSEAGPDVRRQLLSSFLGGVLAPRAGRARGTGRSGSGGESRHQ
ncbi:MAG: prephenate dehydrogenase [Dehalococcoidia bacterium]